MTDSEAKKYVELQTMAPDDLLINGKRWKLETTYLTRKEALGSAEFFDTYKLYKYTNGYALYERNYD